ncbi:MAG: response regulator [bacterium]|nr:response regulator [bacterium]
MEAPHQLKILIVDDENIVHETLSGFIRDFGHRSESVHNGADAAKLIDDHDYDLALIDVRMPGIDGLELLEQIRRKIPPLKVIIMTGHGDPIMSEKAKLLGAYGFLSKPFNLTDFMALIDKIVKKNESFGDEP